MLLFNRLSFSFYLTFIVNALLLLTLRNYCVPILLSVQQINFIIIIIIIMNEQS